MKKNSAPLSLRPDWVDDLVDKITFNEFKDRIFTLLDKVMGELKTIREEQIAISGKTSETTDHIENHDKRITQIEKTLFS